MNIKEKTISLIKKNRISSVEVADALGKKGVLEGPRAINSNKFAVGEVKYIYSFLDSNWPIHEQIENITEGGIAYVDALECNPKAAFGDLVTKYLVLYKRMEGVVVNSMLRDGHILKKENYPLWATGIHPLGFYNKKVELPTHLIDEVEKRKKLFQGSIMVCDDSGCTLIEKEFITEDTYKKLEFIELQEDIWYYCIDTLKWSTYQTICEKRYLIDKDVLPEVFRKRLSEYDL